MNKPFHSPYQGYDVLDKWNSPSWDDTTREAIGQRLGEVPVRQFLDPNEYKVLEAACERIIPQPDRDSPVPIAPWIDDKLHRNRKDGYRYEGMPPLREAWKLGLQGLDDEATLRFGVGFSSLPDSRQDEVLGCLSDGDTQAEVWNSLSPSGFFTKHLLFDCISVYYAHPLAWNEIGFGGPASPRGYARTRPNIRDPWEAPIPPAQGDPRDG